MLGAGTVGRAVIDGLTLHPERRRQRGRRRDRACRHRRPGPRARATGGLPAALLTDAPAHLVADPGIDVIVEVMGGDEPVAPLIAAALGAGKAVVTANKHVDRAPRPRTRGCRSPDGAPSSASRRRSAGGIPVLGPLAMDLAGNEIRRVRGIVNGTTNYILTAMAQEGRPYDDVLVDAQELGLRRGRSERRRRGRRRGQQARHPRPARVRSMAGPGRRSGAARRPPAGDGPPGDHRRHATRSSRARRRSA